MTHTLNRIFLFGYIILASLAAFGQHGGQCNCETPEAFEDRKNDAYIIFEGKVLDEKPNWMSGGMKYTFQVRRSWKNPSDEIRFVNSGWEKDCGYKFKKGEVYLVYARKRHNGVETDRCTGTQLLSAATDDLNMLGAGLRPRKPTHGAANTWMILGLAAFSLLFIAFVVIRKKLQR